MADLNVNTSQIIGAHEDTGQNLIINGDFENAPTFVAAQTGLNTFIDGTAAGNSANRSFGKWATVVVASSATTQFDSTVSHSGTNSLKLSALNATGRVVVATGKALTPTLLITADLIPAYPSTSYTVNGWAKTNNVASQAALISIEEFDSSLNSLVNTATSKLTGTNDWTLLSVTWTTNSACAYIQVRLSNNVAGNISDAWFDDLTLVVNGTTLTGNLTIPITPIVTPGIQNVSGPKIWS